jgi:hypothetical protein
MNPSNIQTATVVLKDGRTTLATWSQEFEKPPTIGDSISIAAWWKAPLPGFTEQARVSKIELDTKTRQHRVEAEVIATTRQRPVVFLNSHRIPEELRGKVETYIRTEIPVALPSWEESTEPVAILRVHENGHSLKESLSVLQSRVLKILSAEIHPAGV